MRPLRQLLRRPTTAAATNDTDQPKIADRSWNTLSTLQSGPVADVDGSGVVYPRSRPVSVEIWFGHGERWIRGGSGDGLRQTRVGGLPILETRQKLDDGDVVQTAWADESGDGQGRVIVELANETNVSVVIAVVVRPRGLIAAGQIASARVAGSLVVIDRLPLIELGRVPGAVVSAVDDGEDDSVLLDQLALDRAEISGTSEISNDAGRASIAAILPLTRGATRQVEILEGREEVTVAAAPLDTVQAGWKAHLRATPDLDLPGWPQHLPTSLISSLVGSTVTTGRPLGDRSFERADDSIRAVALSRVGFDWAAAHVADSLLSDVAEGRIDRDRWPEVAAVCGAIVNSEEGREVLSLRSDAVAAVAGWSLSKSRTPNLIVPLVRAVEAAHGSAAAADAAAIDGVMSNPADGLTYLRHGFGLADESAALLEERLQKTRADADFVGLAMAASAVTASAYEPLVPIRSLAGSTWSWSRNGCGDSPHARASLLLGLVSWSLIERPRVSPEDSEVDVFPGASARWLGQKMSFTNVPTMGGRLSVAMRWHGERAALLWEFVGPASGQPALEFNLRCTRVDPTFSTSERSGEALLEPPTELIRQREAESGAAKSSRSLL